MSKFTKEDFTVTPDDLVEAHGISKPTVNNYARMGAFPFAQKGRVRLFHKSTLTETMGSIKRSLQINEHVEPKFIIKDIEKRTYNNNNNKVLEAITDLSLKVDLICEHLGIELEEAEYEEGVELESTETNSVVQ